MIEFKKCPVIDGVAYATLEEGQVAQLQKLFTEGDPENQASWTAKEIAGWIVDHSDQVMDALTMTESSRPKARRVNGGTKKRKPKPLPIIDASETAA